MRHSVMEVAVSLMNQRKFSKAITLLESRRENYEENFDYYLSLGIACLYAGDIGNASRYFQKARAIRLTDSRLLLGQAAIYLRRGDTVRAVRYYTDIIADDPGNKTALRALEFIRKKGDYNTICQWVDSGRIEQFYPALGMNPATVAGFGLVSVCVFVVILLAFNIFVRRPEIRSARTDLTAVVLSESERKNAQEEDISSGVCRYILSSRQITEAYDRAIVAFQQENDNAVQVELNRIVNSNASFAIKQKSYVFMGYLKNATFDTIQKVQKNYTYKEVAADVPLYQDCVVSWSGRISNAQNAGNAFSCDLLVGYETMKRVEGIVPVLFEQEPQPPIDGDKPVRILAKVAFQENRLVLKGIAVFQSVNGYFD